MEGSQNGFAERPLRSASDAVHVDVVLGTMTHVRRGCTSDFASAR